MSPALPVYVERGPRRVFAGSMEWPGWCRSARDEDAAMQTLLDYGPRYAAVTKAAGVRFQPPTRISSFDVVERLKGNATTDFGAPAMAPSSDGDPIKREELDRLRRILDASWSALDRVAKRAGSRTLRKGPRGGGRELEAIVQHVFEAETAYLTKLGGKFPTDQAAKFEAEATRLRGLILDSLDARARDGPLPQPAALDRYGARGISFAGRRGTHWTTPGRSRTGPNATRRGALALVFGAAPLRARRSITSRASSRAASSFRPRPDGC